MSDGPLEDARRCWNLLADDWRVHVGADGTATGGSTPTPCCGRSRAISAGSPCSTPAAARATCRICSATGAPASPAWTSRSG
jgi:hypothetical protein